MIRWKGSGMLIAAAVMLSMTTPIVAQAQTTSRIPHSAPLPPRYPAHHPHVGTIQGVSPASITVEYPVDSPISQLQVPLPGAYLRAGFYPVSHLPLAAGQHVFVLGSKSSHPTIMLLPEARGVLNHTGSSWSLTTTHHSTISLIMNHPMLLGGAQVSSGAKVDVFGTRTESEIKVDILAGTPHVLRAMVTNVQKNRVNMRLETGGAMAYAITDVPPNWASHLSRLKPATPVLAVVSPQGKVLGVLPMRELWQKHSPKSQTSTVRGWRKTVPE